MRPTRLCLSFHPDTGAPLLGECVIAVREELNLHLILLRDVTDDGQHVTLHVPLTPETKDSIDQEQLIKMLKSSTLTNAARPERVHETWDARGSQRENRLLLPLRCASA